MQEGDAAPIGTRRVRRMELHVAPVRPTIQEPVFCDVDAPQEVATAQMLHGTNPGELAAALARRMAGEQPQARRGASLTSRPRERVHRVHVPRHQRVVGRVDVTAQCRLLAHGQIVERRAVSVTDDNVHVQ